MGHRPSLHVPRVGLLSMLVVLGACDLSEPLQGYELSGRITERLDNGEVSEQGIPGATITFTSDTRIIATTSTDGSGRYRMRILTDHEFGQVRAEAGGFIPGEASVFFDAPTRRIDLSLTGAP